MTTTRSPSSPAVPLRWTGPLAVGLVLLADLVTIHLARQVSNIPCHIARYSFCGVADNILLASYAMAAGLALLGMFRRDALRELLAQAGIRRQLLLAHMAGMLALLATLPVLQGDLPHHTLIALAIVWLAAVVSVVSSTALMLAPSARWRRFGVTLGWNLPFVLAAGLAAFALSLHLRTLWHSGLMADWTFALVARILTLWGQQVDADAAAKIIGANDFYVNIAPSCSGVEGLVLTTTFALIYLVLFRRDLRFPQALLILPVALCLSWLLNGVRIAGLVQIGLSGHPELAVGGFHSHAGWLMFTLLSLGIVLATQATGLFRKARPVDPPPLPPFLADPMVARILPFGIFMASALLAATFSAAPGLVYPLRALAMTAALALVWRHLAVLPWRIDPLALTAGTGIAAYWIVLSPPAAPDPATAGLGGAAFGLWLATRVLGTTLLVPVIEELFFRGYLLERIAPHGANPWRTVLAVLVTSALFAVLHDRWIAALAAGLIFALLTLRRRNLTDAILAHAIANGLIAVWAVATGNWAVV